MDLSLEPALISAGGIDFELGLPVLGSELLVRFLQVCDVRFRLLEFDSCLSIVSLQSLVLSDLLLTCLLQELTSTLSVSYVLVLLVELRRLLRFDHLKLVS